jgi:hypothetical protein
MAGGGNIDSIKARVQKPVDAPDLRRQQPGPGDQLDLPMMPPDCPVTALGIQGLKLWLLDAANQIQQLNTDCRKGDMTLVFGGDGWLIDNFPQFSNFEREHELPASKFDQNRVQTALITACWAKGIFDPQGRVFGRGAHRAGEDDDKLVLHMGRNVLIAGESDKKGKLGPLSEHPAGQIDGKFYPALGALPPPDSKASTIADAESLMELFRQWNWLDKDAAPLLLLGMSAQMHICGALVWRSHMWLAAQTTAGKSSLQKLLRAIHGGWCLHTEDASEAAVRQTLGDDTLPVLIDEAEADDNPERQKAILNLLKKASSGAKMHRGSSDHRAQEFTAQSAFLLSSVLHSLVKGEEWNRVVVLQLRPAERADTMWQEPPLKHWRQLGRKMHRRMIEQWPRFARTLADYKLEIWRHGLGGRWQDTYGTLLACADCLLFDCAPSMESELNDGYGREKRWVQMMLPMMYQGQSQARSDEDRCLLHLMSTTLAGEHGRAPEAVGHWVKRAMTLRPTEDNDPTGGMDAAARDRLKSNGMRLVRLKDSDKGWKLDGEPQPSEDGWNDPAAYLAVAYPTCVPLRDLFRGSDWAGGRWMQSLGRIPGAVTNRLKIRFAGELPDNAIAVPLRALRGEP